jgi:hypothetical protein
MANQFSRRFCLRLRIAAAEAFPRGARYSNISHPPGSFFFEPLTEWQPSDAASLPVWVDQTDPRIPYGFPDIDGDGIKVAFHRAGPRFDPDFGTREIMRDQIREAAEYLRLRFPAWRAPVFRQARACPLRKHIKRGLPDRPAPFHAERLVSRRRAIPVRTATSAA